MQVITVIAFRNLLQARRRTALLSTAIGIVTALLVILTSVTGGIRFIRRSTSSNKARAPAWSPCPIRIAAIRHRTSSPGTRSTIVR